MVVTIRPTRAPSLGDQLADVLRDEIVRRVLEPGTHLVEDALAAKYDVSRGPVRDALRQLESQGLVESRRRGFHVIGLTDGDVDDLYELREAIEVVAARRAADNLTDELMQRARAAVDDMSTAADRSDVEGFAAADMRFHAMLYEAGGNRRLRDVWEDYAPVFANIMHVTLEEDTDLRPSAADHAALLDILERGDADEVAKHLRTHLQDAHARMSSALQGIAAESTEDRAS